MSVNQFGLCRKPTIPVNIWNHLFFCFVPFKCGEHTSLREKCPDTKFFLVRIQCECGKIRTRKNYLDNFHAVTVCQNLSKALKTSKNGF